METSDRHLAIHNLALLQRQAGVDRGVAELVVAYGRLRVDAGEPLDFRAGPFPTGSTEHRYLAQLQQRQTGLDDRFLAFVAAYCARMEHSGRVPLINRDDLAERSGYPLEQILFITAKAPAFYRQIRLPRPNKADRVLHSPTGPLRDIQSWIQREILSQYRPHPSAHGFVRKRSIASHAIQHTGRKVLVTLDLADFFPSVGFRQVRKGFERLGYPYAVAVLLAGLCTRNGCLPQGAPTSPALSNLVCENLDRRLAGLSTTSGFAYSRYADDLALSSDDRRLSSVIPAVRKIIEEEGFRLRQEKTRVTGQGARQVVTGVTVNHSLSLPRRSLRRLRAAAHRLSTHGPQDVFVGGANASNADVASVLSGHRSFVSMIKKHARRA